MIWRLYYERQGDHVHCRLFCGPQKGALGKCGDLTFRHDEFANFTRIHRVLGVEFFREVNADGSLAGMDEVHFDNFGEPSIHRRRALPDTAAA